jgi:hypothetical protein
MYLKWKTGQRKGRKYRRKERDILETSKLNNPEL